ncbi:cyclic nucleotide-binding protein [Pedobacter sp. Leaf41]|jgi:CRP-like cAMP-binding protein|uniref:Crp/Fnr family transcriptional regulator n=1 Tax=Pedobacter sp. Leaf41 TaxID=1736218 RepID=UPI0007039C53|nr:Crp/Fnr family transcriptional regulator [Pedobacter sp. Leaf41]KQN38712.1 cyclic nucleotide-binding protein [Pedobacter sp. Leaf41]RZL69132.1 MAG: Crp/Fnr family transcriptional regulator [Pedobacter sp.]
MDIQQLIDHGYAIKVYPKDTLIYEPGMVPRYVYFIKSGEVRMVTVSEDGKEFIQGIFKMGQYFGEPALIINRKYLAYTIANKESEIIQVGRKQFFDLIETTPGFSINLIQTLSNRLFYKSMMLEELANEKAEHRLLTIINYLLNDIEVGDSLKVTRQDLADMTGLRVETVIREIKILSDKGLIEVNRGKIIRPNKK